MMMNIARAEFYLFLVRVDTRTLQTRFQSNSIPRYNVHRQTLINDRRWI